MCTLQTFYVNLSIHGNNMSINKPWLFLVEYKKENVSVVVAIYFYMIIEREKQSIFFYLNDKNILQDKQ